MKGKTPEFVFASYLAFLAVIPFGEMPLIGTHEVLTVTKAAFLVLMAGLGWAAARGWRPRMVPVLYGLMVLFITGTLLSAFFSTDPRHALMAWIRVPSMSMLCLVTFWVVDGEPGRARSILWWCVGLAGLFAALGIYQTLTGSTIGNLGYYSSFGRLMSVAVSDVPGAVTLVRASATFDHPSMFGNYLILVLPFGILMLKDRQLRDWRTWGLAAVLTAGMLALVFTLSRGAWLGMAAALLVIGMARAGARAGWILLTIAFMAAWLLIPVAARPILLSRSHQTQYYDGTRLVSYQTAARILEHHPLLGVGPDMFDRSYKLYVRPGTKIRQNAAHRMDAHNTFLDLASETGIMGLLSFLAILGWGMSAIVRRLRLTFSSETAAAVDARLVALSTAAAMVAFIVQGLFQSLEYQEIFWIIMGITVAISRNEAHTTSMSRILLKGGRS